MTIRIAYKTKTKKLFRRLLASTTLAAISLGVFVLLGSGVEAGYKRPVSQRKAVRTFTPVILPAVLNTISGSSYAPQGVSIGDIPLGAAVAVSDAVILDLKLSQALAPVTKATTSVTEWVEPAVVRYSQTSAGGGGDAVLLRESLSKFGWRGDPAIIIRTPEGLVTYDNTRVAIARELGIEKIPVKIYELDQALPDEVLQDAFWSTKGVKTWGDVLKVRTLGQNNPLPLYGTTVPPKLSTTLPSPEKAAAFWREAELLPDLTLKVKNPGLIEKIGAWLAQKFPNAAAAGESFLGGAAKVLGKLGPLFAVAGLFFGLLQMGYSGSKLYEMMQADGIFEALGTKEGKVEALNTLSGFFGAIAGGAFLLTTATAATVVGAPAAAVAGSVAVIAGALSLLFAGTAFAVENWETIKATAEKVWEGLKDAAVKGYRWVANSVGAAQAWAAENVQRLVAGTKSALQAAGKWGGELVRGAVQTTEKVVKTVTELVPKVVEYIEEKVTPVIKTATRLVEKTVEVAKEIVDKVVKTGERLVTKIVEEVKQIPKTIYETVTRLVDKVVPVVRQVTDYVTTKVEETYQYVKQVVKNVVETVKERVQEAYEVVKQIPRQVTEWVTERVQEAKKVARTVYDNVREWVTERVQETYSFVKQVARTVWTTVTEWVPQSVKSWLGRAFGWVTKWVSQTRQVAQTVYQNVTEYATRWVNKTREVVRQVPRTVYDTVTNWVDRGKQVTRTVYDTVRETAYRWVEKPVQKVKQIVETVWQTGTRLADKVVPVVRQVTDYVTTKVAETYQVAKTVYDTVVEKVPQQVKEAYEYVVDVPRRVVETVKVVVPEVYSYVENVVEKITSTKTEIVPTTRQVEETIVKTVEGWVPTASTVSVMAPQKIESVDVKGAMWSPTSLSVGLSTPAVAVGPATGISLDSMVGGAKLTGGAVVGAIENLGDLLKAGAKMVYYGVTQPKTTGEAIIHYGQQVVADPVGQGKELVDGYVQDIASRWDASSDPFDKGRAIGYAGLDAASIVFSGGLVGAAKTTGKEVAEKAAKEIAEKTAKEVAERVAKETAEKTAKEAAEKTAKEAAEKAAAQTVKNIEYVDRKQLLGRQLPNEYTGQNIKQLTESMLEKGFDPNYPVEVFEFQGKKIVIDGHHRVRAAGAAGIDQVPVRYISEKELLERWNRNPWQLLAEMTDARAAFDELMRFK